jgi:ABC-2 type transport system ATP-binding protein
VGRLYKSSGRGVSDVSFSVAPGEVFGLMGPNGSGKSTLLRVLSTAIVPDRGSFRVGGLDGLEEKRRVRARLGLMVDRPTHYDDLTGMANAYFFARAYGMDEGKAEGALAELFGYFDLAEYAGDKVKTYSYGMGKKLALIEALAHGPEVLLLDEPSLGLDYTSQLAYQRRIRDLADEGVAILLASNQVDEVESLCDRAAFLHRGRLVAEGTPEELISSVKGVSRMVATLRNPVEYGSVAGVEGVQRIIPE